MSAPPDEAHRGHGRRAIAYLGTVPNEGDDAHTLRAGRREAFCLCQRALALPAIARDQASTNAQPEGQQATRVGEEWLHPVLIRHTGIHCREQETRDRDSNLA